MHRNDISSTQEVFVDIVVNAKVTFALKTMKHHRREA